MSKIEIKDSKDAIFNYLRYFDKPSEVIQDKTLSNNDKIQLLKGWKHDVELEEVAEAENMHASTTDILDEIVKALLLLQIPNDTKTPPTKLGRI